MDNLPPDIRERLTEKMRTQEFREAAAAKMRQRWADPESRAKLVSGIKRSYVKKRVGKTNMTKLNETKKRRDTLARKIRFLPGARVIAKWIVK